jgi:hypothetical protein
MLLVVRSCRPHFRISYDRHIDIIHGSKLKKHKGGVASNNMMFVPNLMKIRLLGVGRGSDRGAGL